MAAFAPVSPADRESADTTLAFELTVAPNATVRGLRFAVLGLGAAGLALAAWLARGNPDGPYLLGFGVLMLWVAWRHGGLGLAWGRLRVDADGRAAWQTAGAEQDFMPAKIDRWHCGEQLVWIRLRTADGKRRQLMVGRTGIGDEPWRKLSVWLHWLARGRAQ